MNAQHLSRFFHPSKKKGGSRCGAVSETYSKLRILKESLVRVLRIKL